MKALAEDFDGVATKLAAGPYAEPALVPVIRPPQGPLPPAPRVTDADGGIRFEPSAEEAVWLWVVRIRRGEQWLTAILPGQTRRYEPDQPVDELTVAAVARDGRMGPATRLGTAAP